MNQLIFDFASHDYPGFDKFLGTENAELVYVLQHKHGQFIYVWGEEGAGKSHLLQAWVAQALDAGRNALYIDAAATPLTEAALDAEYLAIDQIEKLNNEEQALLFAIFNRFRNSGKGFCFEFRIYAATTRYPRRPAHTHGVLLGLRSQTADRPGKIDALVSIAAARQVTIDPRNFRIPAEPLAARYGQPDANARYPRQLRRYDGQAHYFAAFAPAFKTTGNPMKNLAIFDLDNTLINTDSDHSWPQYLIKKGIVDAAETEAQNEKFYQDYQNGCLDIDAFLKFHLAPLARFSKEELAEFHREFMAEYIVPHISPMQRMLVQSHQMAGDEMLVISSTNEFIITPICHLFGIHNIIGTQLETGEDGRYTGNYIGTPSLKEGKITRLNQWLAERGETFESYGKVYFYSDSKNDLPLLRIVDEPVAVNPDAELEKEAKAKGWPILNFK